MKRVNQEKPDSDQKKSTSTFFPDEFSAQSDIFDDSDSTPHSSDSEPIASFFPEEKTDPNAEQTATVEIALEGISAPASVLVLEDEALIQRALKRILDQDGYRTFVAASTSEAEKILESEEIDVLLTDNSMPGRTGLQFLSDIEKADAFDLHRNTPAFRIMLTASGDDPEFRARAFNLSCVDIIMAKPWKADELRSVIRDGAFVARQRKGQFHR